MNILGWIWFVQIWVESTQPFLERRTLEAEIWIN